jgi:uncharacterized protein YabN with tetrapyrrole methylase and pyrophosphatase domain
MMDGLCKANISILSFIVQQKCEIWECTKEESQLATDSSKGFTKADIDRALTVCIFTTTNIKRFNYIYVKEIQSVQRNDFQMSDGIGNRSGGE